MTTYYGIEISITYQYRICNGVIEFRYLDYSAIGNGNYMAEFEYLQYNFSALRELIDMHMIEHAVNDLNAYEMPNCDNGTMLLVKFYAANCGVWLKCSYKVDKSSEKCDEGYEGEGPSYEVNGETWVDTWKWQPCGTSCCKKTYSVCEAPTSLDPRITSVQIKNMEIEPGECTEEGTFKDWRTGQVIPCSSCC